MNKVAIILINIYQRTLSPNHGPFAHVFPLIGCKYYPSCSEYTKRAINKHGLKGYLMGLKRLLRCNPFSHGGYDPIPHPEIISNINHRQ